MRKNIELKEDEIKKYINELYNCFKNGYKFEEFIKIYLEKIGLDEIVVTQRSRDGGKDLTAIRPGVGNFSDSDVTHYYIQCKRFNPSSTISVRSIRELKGIIPFGQKGIFITTAKFSKDAIEEANNDISKPIVLIDGKSLIESCIEHELGFVFSPVFSSKLIEEMMNREIINNTVSENRLGSSIVTVEKNVTTNDLRAKIIRVPNEFLKYLDTTDNTLSLKLGNDNVKKYKFNKNGKFISGVSKFFFDYKYIDELGVYNPRKAIWKYDGNIIFVEGE